MPFRTRRVHTCKTTSICPTCLFKMQRDEIFKPSQNKSISCNLGNLCSNLWHKMLISPFLSPVLISQGCAVLVFPSSLPPIFSLSFACLSLCQTQFCCAATLNEIACSSLSLSRSRSRSLFLFPSLLSYFFHKVSQASDHFLYLFQPPPPLLHTVFHFMALHFI